MKEQRAPVVEDDEPSTTASTVPAASVADDEPAAPPPTKTQSARVVELLARQEEEHWPAQGSDEWLLARTRIISASEASTALGIDNFRTPERLIRDKLARLDKFESVSEAILAASRDETRASYLAAVQAEKVTPSLRLGARETLDRDGTADAAMHDAMRASPLTPPGDLAALVFSRQPRCWE